MSTTAIILVGLGILVGALVGFAVDLAFHNWKHKRPR